MATISTQHFCLGRGFFGNCSSKLHHTLLGGPAGEGGWTFKQVVIVYLHHLHCSSKFLPKIFLNDQFFHPSKSSFHECLRTWSSYFSWSIYKRQKFSSWTYPQMQVLLSDIMLTVAHDGLRPNRAMNSEFCFPSTYEKQNESVVDYLVMRR